MNNQKTYNEMTARLDAIAETIPEKQAERAAAAIRKAEIYNENNTLVFCFTDGTQTVKQWPDHSRRQSWTPNMKEAARKKELERRSHHEKCYKYYCYSGNH